MPLIATAAGSCGLLLDVLAQPSHATSLTPPQWTALLAAARAANLLGTLAARLTDAGIDLPPAPARHLSGALHLSLRQADSVRWETHCIARALAPLGTPVVLLKGAAYVLTAQPPARGRLFGDIDILVPRDAVGRAELRLMVHGWTTGKSDPYDQRYYREWMHEIPPLMHVRRGTMLDVHHTILPLTSRHRPDPAKLIARAVDTQVPGIKALSPLDLVLHSITHLVHEGELHNGLRDLVDIDALLRAQCGSADDWRVLAERAAELDLEESVGLGLHLAARHLSTPVPSEWIERLLRNRRSRRMLDWAYDRALAPAVESEEARWAGLARSLIYIRAHWLRMPPLLLARHLGRKAWMGWRARTAPATP